jgi:ribosomal protein L37AE/L43A
MGRPYKPVPLDLKGVPGEVADAYARCPSCERAGVAAIGRIGLRLVFRCEKCHVNFFRQAPRPITHIA